MDDSEYNGYTNYETWAVAVWLDNDRSSYHHMQGLTRDVWREAPQSQAVQDGGWSREEAAEHRLAELMQEFVEEGDTTPANTLYADLMCAALCEVNWHEIARSYVADAIEEMESGGDKTDEDEGTNTTTD